MIPRRISAAHIRERQFATASMVLGACRRAHHALLSLRHHVAVAAIRLVMPSLLVRFVNPDFSTGGGGTQLWGDGFEAETLINIRIATST